VQTKKRPRLPRIEREEEVAVHEDDNSHLWAVSYSDFLMALLSFFILFFSADNHERDNMVMELATQFQSSGTGTGLNQAGTGHSMESKPGRLPSSLIDSLKGLDVTTDKEKHVLIVNFPNDFFLPGQHSVSADQESKISHFLDVLAPYKSSLSIYFEGHADQQPLVKSKSHLMTDNFVLSSLRASSALIIARKKGFAEKDLYIAAASSNIRNTRSLTVRIEPKGEKL
jgi:flagellar motor protein MotB